MKFGKWLPWASKNDIICCKDNDGADHLLKIIPYETQEIFLALQALQEPIYSSLFSPRKEITHSLLQGGWYPDVTSPSSNQEKTVAMMTQNSK